MMKVPPPFAHQKTSILFLDKRDRVFDMSDPGTGKTRVHIEAFARRHKKDKRSALVFAPKSILQSAWGNDIEKFAPHLKYIVATADNRKDAFETPADVYITNIDAATWIAKQPAKFFKRFSHLIIDESTAYKHRTSLRSKAMAKIKKYFEVRRNLSGTPNPNGVCDLWHQVYILDDGKRLGSSFFHFRSAVCIPEQTGPRPEHVSWVDRDGAELAVTGLLKDISIRHALRDCIDMPENVVYNVQYIMPPKHLAYYLKLENDSLLMIREHKVDAQNGAVLYGKLLQTASGAVYDNQDSYVVLDTGRYELIADLVEQRAHSIVFFLWEHQRELLRKEFEARDISYAIIDGSVKSAAKRNEITGYFQKGFYRTLLLHPQSTAHGLTLTKASAAIWASPTVNAEWWKQANHRHDRAGQTQRTETIVITATATRDENVYALCTTKNFKMKSLLDEVALG